MLLDLHLHEKTCSPDSVLSLSEIVAAAKSRGLGGVCITDHESMGLRDYAARYSAVVGFPIFVGVEYLTVWGDITAFGLSEVPPQGLSTQDFLDKVQKAGGISFSAHPFRNNRRGLGEHLLSVRHLTGVETLNGSTAPLANAQALAYCTRLGLGSVGGSDAHVPDKIAVCCTYLPVEVATLSELIAAFRAGGSLAMYWDGARYCPQEGATEQ